MGRSTGVGLTGAVVQPYNPFSFALRRSIPLRAAHSPFRRASHSLSTPPMMVKIMRSAVVAALALSMSAINVAQSEELCSITPTSYATAKTDYPDLAFALSTVEDYSIAAWYTDRLSTTDRATMLKDITSKCSEDSRMTIVVYGIPNKDCNAGYSSGGTVSNTADYKTFLSDLTTAVGDRKVLYVVEPDAVGLLAEDGGCGSSAGYLDNLKVAVKALSANANAELYVDVGYWTLEYDSQRSKVVTTMKELATSGTLKGVAINTSNYRSTSQLSELCTNFQTAMGSKTMSCIADTSRNYVAPTTTDWCNVLTAGIGAPPTSETNVSNLDYFMWIKPPGESDGTCNGGPAAGSFFETGFQKLWDQGYFVNKLGKNTIAEGGSDTSASQTSSQSKGSSAQTTSTPATDDSATAGEADTGSSQLTETSASESVASSASQTTDTSASESSASQTTETTDTSASESSASQTTETTAPTATTTAPTATTAAPSAMTTEAPASQTSNCKVKPLALTSSLVQAEDLCSIAPNSYSKAKTDHPELSKALEALEQHAIASWFTDRMTTDERSTMISSMLSQCSEDTRLSIVVYGIPNKDCDAGYSSGGNVKSTDDYKAFLKELTDAVGDRKVLYVVEPDAVGLLAKEGSCGASAGYLDNLKVAVTALSANANAELYIDVGYWMLADSANAAKIAPIMQELGSRGKVKGVTINTSNYRSNDECATYCTNFQTAMGKSDMSCVVDTSRNYAGNPTSDWCNVVTAGIGKPPSSDTGVSNLDYFMWIKPPGESDGECSGGTAAGSFYAEGFTKLWDQGYFVSEGGMKMIKDGTGDILHLPLAMAALAWSTVSSAEDLCSITPSSYSGAKTTYPQLATALETMEQYSIAAWYTDRLSDSDRSTMLSSLTSECSEDTRMTIAVYGIPDKDCNAGLSSSGTVQSTSDYQSFLSQLTTAVGNRKVLYIVEPDAVGLLANGGCGESAGYLDNLKIAVAALSANSNAELYVDVGYWLLADSTNAAAVATIINELSASGTLKGVTINTSNYRSNDECSTYCNNFQTAMGSTSMTCIIDTSRNYNGSPSSDWCNVKTAGIGKPPTSETGISNIDYFMWVKPPGESDGICTDTSYSGESLTGVTAGTFYEEGFQVLWDQGYFVSEKGMSTISGTSSNSTSQTSQSQTSSQTGTQTSSQAGTQTAGSGVDQTSSVAQDYDSSTKATAGTVAPADTESSQSTTTAPPTTTASPTAATSTPIATTTAPTATPTATGSSTSQTSASCKAKKPATAVSCMALALSSLVSAEDLCSITPASYTGAKADHPELMTAIETLENYAIASWFTDRQTTQEHTDMMSGLLSQCSEETRLSIVVYGIPNKDCAAGLSSDGSVKNTDDYKAFLKELTDAVGDRKVLYVVEPDALGLLTQDGSCGASAGYLDNLKVAVEALSANPNAELYLDIGYWMLEYGTSAGNVATAMKDISTCGRVKGVTINTSNYRSNDECTTYCTNFQSAMDSSDMRCIVDTSRNYNGNPTTDWCNVPTAGIGKPPTSETDVSNIDYFMWIKPPGESDGECATTGGPSAGSFYLEGFKQLWDQGYFVKEQGMPKIGDTSSTATQSPPSSSAGSVNQNQDEETSTPTSTPVAGSSSWNQEQSVGTVAPADTISTEAPTSTTTIPYTSTPETTSPSTMAPVTETSAPYILTTPPITSSPSTTAPTEEATTTEQTGPIQSRSSCKAKKSKKRLRSL
ncbi:Endoglucanase A [Phytophthora citrophthora]|uniref:Endoglucanase A n=1 Tax=Phytophthora citrophthora TaxID=4793 RepID=A0AAD9G475_9STRA|nr:Endoglucanase A [Phytophthora citrophthora]